MTATLTRLTSAKGASQWKREHFHSAINDGPLFPSRNQSKNQLIHDSSIMQAIERWYTNNKQAPLQTRDLRRTWKSRTADAGIDRFIRDVIQQHTNQDTGSKNYDRANYLPQMREAMTKWEKWLDKVCKGKAA